jgi:hypothetical protein
LARKLCPHVGGANGTLEKEEGPPGLGDPPSTYSRTYLFAEPATSRAMPNRLVDKSYCRCANDNATSVTGKPNPDLSIKYARFSHSPQQLSSQRQRNLMRHPICGWLQLRPRTAIHFSTSLALLVDGSDSPPQGRLLRLRLAAPPEYPTLLTTCRVAQFGSLGPATDAVPAPRVILFSCNRDRATVGPR